MQEEVNTFEFAKRCERLAGELIKKPHSLTTAQSTQSSWAIVLFFYSSLHYARLYCIRQNIIPPNKHKSYTKRSGGRVIGMDEFVTNNFSKKIAAKYLALFDASLLHRYDPATALSTTKTIAQGFAKHHFAIKSYVLGKSGTTNTLSSTP